MISQWIKNPVKATQESGKKSTDRRTTEGETAIETAQEQGSQGKELVDRGETFIELKDTMKIKRTK